MTSTLKKRQKKKKGDSDLLAVDWNDAKPVETVQATFRLPPRDQSELSWRLLEGDALRVARSLPDDSVHLIVTSVPYWLLRDYGVPGQLGLEETVEEWVKNQVRVFREFRRVLHPSGSIYLNCGDCFYSSRSFAGPGKNTDGVFTRVHDRMTNVVGKRLPKHKILKSKDLIMQPDRLAIGLQRDGWWIRGKIIWWRCLSGGVKLYAKTARRFARPIALKDLARLEPSTVKLWNGQRWTRVKAWMPVGKVDGAYSLILRSGERIDCSPDHRWPTLRGLIATSDLRLGDVIETVRLPAPNHPISPAALDDREIGWFLGLYLAEGSRSAGCLQFSGHVSETEARRRRLAKIAAAYHGTCRAYSTGGNGATVNVHGRILISIVETYITGSTAQDKHLRPCVWARNNNFLEGILAGYLEGDAHLDVENKRWRLGFCRNRALALNLRTLGARLDYRVKIQPSFGTKDGVKFPRFIGEVRCGPGNGHHNERPLGEIVKVEKSRARLFWDVEVEDAPHTFALASGVVTHNSNSTPQSPPDRPPIDFELIHVLTKKPKGYFYDRYSVWMPPPPPPNTLKLEVLLKQLDSRGPKSAIIAYEIQKAVKRLLGPKSNLKIGRAHV